MSDFSSPSLIEKINQAIEQAPNQILPFDKFMEMALYEPKLGYYSASHRQLGPQGDFVTSPHLCADFGELIALQLKDFWQSLGCPQTFTVVEMGAGQGLITVDALRYLLNADPDDPFLKALEWKIIERSEALIRWQKHYLQKRISPLLPQEEFEQQIQWTTLTDLQSQPIVGCIFSNELIDAFPVHWLEVRHSAFVELGVMANSQSGQFNIQAMPLSEEVEAYLAEFPIECEALPEGYRCEVNPGVKSWIASVAEVIAQGFVLTIDYGYNHEQLYSPARRDGTLQCYFNQKSHGDPLIHVGQQDITSHVDFSALKYFGECHHLTSLGLIEQGLFLMSLGLGDRIYANNQQNNSALLQETLQRRESLHALMNPMGLGGFKVLLQGKGLSEEQQKYPFQGFKEARFDSILGTS